MPDSDAQERRDFFISHAGADQGWAEWVGQQLIRAGYTVELDVWEWNAGENLVEAMRLALERADRVLAIWSEKYFARPFAQAEHQGAFTAAVSGRQKRVVPVLVENCEIPELYASLIRIELTGLDQAAATTRLLAGIADPTGPPDHIVEFPVSEQTAATRADGEGNVQMESVDFPHPLPPIWNIPPRNPFFTGRAPLLMEIARLLGQPRVAGGGVGIVPVQGMGGVGKTQLAIEYAHRFSTNYQLVWWIDADSPTLTLRGLTELAAALGLPLDGPPSAAIRELWVILSRRDDWLLIYDNVNDPADIAELRPPASGHLLITSRSPTIGRFTGYVVDVPEFDRAESISLLLRRRTDLSVDQADELADALGDLPLAVEQCGCFLADSGLEVIDYLDLLTAKPAAAGLRDPTLDRHPGLAVVVAASVARLSSLDAVATDLVKRMAYLAPEPLPLTPRGARSRRFGIRIGGAATTAEVVRRITNLALARRSGAALQMHRLVQALIRAAQAEDEQTRAHQAAQRLLVSAQPGDANNAKDWPSFAALTPHVQALISHLDTPTDGKYIEIEEFRLLVLDIAYYLYTSGQYDASLSMSEEQIERWRRILGPDHLDTLAMSNNKAFALIGAGNFSTAVKVSSDTLVRCRRTFGDDDNQTLHSANGLAGALDLVGDHVAARALHEDTLARFRRVLGFDHPDALNSAINLGVVLVALEAYADARELCADTLSRCQQTLGVDHPYSIRSADYLTGALIGLREYASAEDLGQDALARARRILGRDHPDTLHVAGTLAFALSRLGRTTSARALAEDTLARCHRVLGDEHPRTVTVVEILAGLPAADFEQDTGAV